MRRVVTRSVEWLAFVAFRVAFAMIPGAGRATTGDPLPPPTTILYEQHFDGPLDTILADFHQGIGPYAGQPQTQMHIGTGETSAAFNGNFLKLGINPFETRTNPLRAWTGPLSSAQRKAWLAAVDKAVSDAAAAVSLKAGYVAKMRAVQWSSWALTTRRTFKPPLGAELCGNFPAVAGMWPGFYLFDYAMGPYWPIEIDGMEGPEKSSSWAYWFTAHDKSLPGGKTGKRIVTPGPVAGGKHCWAVVVQPKEIISYFDGREMARIASGNYAKYNFAAVVTMSIDGWPRLLGNPPVPGTRAKSYLSSLRVWVP